MPCHNISCFRCALSASQVPLDCPPRAWEGGGGGGGGAKIEFFFFFLLGGFRYRVHGKVGADTDTLARLRPGSVGREP